MVHNRPRLHPQRLTRINYRAYLYTRSLQTNYYRRITSLKARFMGVNPIRSIPKPLHERHPRMAVDLVDFFGICVGDLVQVRWGADRHKRGVVLAVKPRTNQVIVEGCALKEKRTHPQCGTPGRPSRVYIETPIHITNVKLLDPVTKTHTEVKLRKTLTGEKVRLSSRSGSAMPPPAPVAKTLQASRDTILYYKKSLLKKITLTPLRRIVPLADQASGLTATALHTLARNSRQTRHQARVSLIKEKQRLNVHVSALQRRADT